MPIYEYRCQACGKKQNIFWRSLSAVNESKSKCVRCGSSKLVRLMSKVRVVRGASESNGASANGSDDALMNEMAGLDENDPRALAGFMRKMAQESGEDMGPEFDEVVGRLEKGEDPEKIEQSMGDLFGGDELGGPGGMGMGMDDDYGAPQPDNSAEKAEETKDKKATEKRRTVAMKGKASKARKRAATSKKSVAKGRKR
jgi:putative FmdB family regulatory protein